MPHVYEHVGEIEDNKSKTLQNKGKIIFPNMWAKIFTLEDIKPTLCFVVSQYINSNFRSKAILFSSYLTKGIKF